VNNIYPLALAYLTAGPAEKSLDGLWFIARAANLIADPKGKADVIKFGKSKYRTITVVKKVGTHCWRRPRHDSAPADFTIKQYIPPHRPSRLPTW